MNSSIATVSISGDLRDKLSAIAKAGFDGVEVFEQDFVTYDGTPRDVGALVADHGLKIDLFQPFRDFEGLPGAARARAFDRAERKFDPMAELGTDLLLVSSSTNPEALGCVDRIASRTGMRLTLKARAISSWRSCTPEARLPCTIASLSASWTMSAADRDREASVA